MMHEGVCGEIYIHPDAMEVIYLRMTIDWLKNITVIFGSGETLAESR